MYIYCHIAVCLLSLTKKAEIYMRNRQGRNYKLKSEI